MIKWEYYAIKMEWHLFADIMDRAGNDGWELAAVEDGVFVFKRPVED